MVDQEKLKIVEVPIGDLKPAEYNPRMATEKQAQDLKESLKRFGFVDPVIVNSAPKRKNIIIGGHFRVRVARDMGIKKVPVVYIKISDIRKEQELNLRLNRNLGQWDYDLLANYDEEMLLDVGFEASELDNIFGLDIDAEFDVEKELEKILKEGARRVKDGDLWQLGAHKLIIGDCTKKENWERLLGQERFAFMFTDPPYKLAYSKTRTRKIKTGEGMKLKRARTYLKTGETDKKGKPKGFGYKGTRTYKGVERRGGVPEYDEWLSIANEFQDPQGANVMIFENWRNTVELWQAIEKYWKIKNMVIWHLPNRCQGFSRKYMFFNKYDIAPLASKGESVLNEGYEKELDDYLREKGQALLDTYEVMIYGQQGDSYWDKRKGTRWARANDHITHSAATGKSSGQSIIFGTKPLQILLPYIKILSPRYGIVKEPFGGSGSTLIGCEIMKRKCRAMEIEPIYGEVILARWEKLTGKKAVRIKQ